MSKKRSRSRSTVQGSRDTFDIANQGLRPLPTLSRSGRSLEVIEDRRAFYPGPLSPVRTIRRLAPVLFASPSTRKNKKTSLAREVYSFGLPRTTAVCVRRAVRKQVIHAAGVAGSRVRKPKRNAQSKISCRRK